VFWLTWVFFRCILVIHSFIRSFVHLDYIVVEPNERTSLAANRRQSWASSKLLTYLLSVISSSAASSFASLYHDRDHDHDQKGKRRVIFDRQTDRHEQNSIQFNHNSKKAFLFPFLSFFQQLWTDWWWRVLILKVSLYHYHPPTTDWTRLHTNQWSSIIDHFLQVLLRLPWPWELLAGWLTALGRDETRSFVNLNPLFLCQSPCVGLGSSLNPRQCVDSKNSVCTSTQHHWAPSNSITVLFGVI